VREIAHDDGRTKWVQHRGKAKRCAVCGPLWLKRAIARIEALTEHDDVLYIATVADAEWTATPRRRIGRRGHGATVAAVDEHTKLVLTPDDSLPDAHRLPRDEAIAQFTHVALMATMRRHNARVDFCGTWHPTASIHSSTQAEASASVRSAEGDPSTSRDECRGSALNPCRRKPKRATATSGWHEVRSTTAQPAFIDIAAKEVGGRFIRRSDHMWHLQGVAEHLLPDFYARIGALTPEERAQRRDEARARADLDAMIARQRAFTRAA